MIKSLPHQGGRGLIAEQQARLPDEGASNGDALLLPAAHLLPALAHLFARADYASFPSGWVEHIHGLWFQTHDHGQKQRTERGACVIDNVATNAISECRVPVGFLQSKSRFLTWVA